MPQHADIGEHRSASGAFSAGGPGAAASTAAASSIVIVTIWAMAVVNL
jgi:hypothetical protein